MDSTLIKYITEYCQYWMTQDERRALLWFRDQEYHKNHKTYSDPATMKMDFIYGLNDENVQKLIAMGENEFKKYLCERLIAQHQNEIINNCPQCNKLARTPHAKQCRFCGHTWRDQRLLVILDLDETLIHATSNPPHNNWDFEIEHYKIFKRPGLDAFIIKLKEYFDVAVWSSASDDYVNEVVKHIFPENYDLKFVWGRSKCTLQIDYDAIENLGYFDENNHTNYTKRIKKLKNVVSQTKEQILIIDDTPSKARYNYGNAIYPTEFTGDPQDNELGNLFAYLLTFKDVDNVRIIEKRDWRQKALKLKED